MPDNTAIPGPKKGPSLCIELKVKWGFIPNSPFITHEVKRRVDRFTMHQQQKVAKGKLDGISKYCPIDLFSYDRNRVRQCIEALLQTPQNNFRLFVDGMMEYPDSKGHGSRDILQSKLDKHGSFPRGVDGLVDILADILVREPLLKRVKSAQMLDEADIEAVYPIYQKIVERGEDILPLAEGSTLYPREPIKELPTSKEEQHELVRRFMASCTAKDCSVMIVIQPDGSPTSSNMFSDEAVRPVDYPITTKGARTIVRSYKGLPTLQLLWT